MTDDENNKPAHRFEERREHLRVIARRILETARDSDDARERLADAIGAELFAAVESLAPTERVAFVLRDIFDVSFDDIASIVGGTPAAARQLVSRARRRVLR
jgi:RNA polymerase sigma-70 factor (ECF subfamily)